MHSPPAAFPQDSALLGLISHGFLLVGEDHSDDDDGTGSHSSFGAGGGCFDELSGSSGIIGRGGGGLLEAVYNSLSGGHGHSHSQCNSNAAPTSPVGAPQIQLSRLLHQDCRPVMEVAVAGEVLGPMPVSTPAELRLQNLAWLQSRAGVEESLGAAGPGSAPSLRQGRGSGGSGGVRVSRMPRPGSYTALLHTETSLCSIAEEGEQDAEVSPGARAPSARSLPLAHSALIRR